MPINPPAEAQINTATNIPKGPSPNINTIPKPAYIPRCAPPAPPKTPNPSSKALLALNSGGAVATLATPKIAGMYHVAALPAPLSRLSLPLSCFTVELRYFDELPHF